MKFTEGETKKIWAALENDVNYTRTFDALIALISDDSIQQQIKKLADSAGNPSQPRAIPENIKKLGEINTQILTLIGGSAIQVLERSFPLPLLKNACQSIASDIHQKAANLAGVDKDIYFAFAGLDSGYVRN